MNVRDCATVWPIQPSPARTRLRQPISPAAPVFQTTASPKADVSVSSGWAAELCSAVDMMRCCAETDLLRGQCAKSALPRRCPQSVWILFPPSAHHNLVLLQQILN